MPKFGKAVERLQVSLLDRLPEPLPDVPSGNGHNQETSTNTL